MPTALELGMQALQEGQPTRAASFFEFALKKAPADPAIRLMAVDAYIQARMYQAAEPHVLQILEQGDVLYQRGEYELLARARSALAKIDVGLGRSSAAAPGQAGDTAAEGGAAGIETAPGDPSIVIGGPRTSRGGVASEAWEEPPAVDLSTASDFAAIEATSAAMQGASAAGESDAGPHARSRVVACPWCTKTVLLDAHFSGRCQCGWFQPARGSRLYLGDLQRLCADRRAQLHMKVHQDIFILDGHDVRLRLMGRKTIKVDPRLAFELDLGHAVLFPDQLKAILPQVHPTAVFRFLENYQPEVFGTESATEGQFYSFSEMVDRLEIEYPDCLALMPRDIHYPYQLSWHLPPELRHKADEQLASGARSYGRCLLYAGMTMEDLLRMVPGWQVLRPVGGGHGRLEGVRSLIRKGFTSEEEAAGAIEKGRGRDSLQCLVDAKLITREVAEDVLTDLKKQQIQPPLRDDIMERLCRRGVISRVTLVRAGLVLGLVDIDAGGDESLSGAMDQIPPEEIEFEKQLLVKKDALRRSERLALGKILVDLGFCTRQKVAVALTRQLREDLPLGEMLVTMLAITPEQLTVALAEQEQRIEALVAPRTETGSEGPAVVPAPPAEEVSTGAAAPALGAEARAEKKAAADTPARKKKGKPRRAEGPPPWLLLGGAGAGVLAVGVALTLLLLHRPGSPAAGSGLPPQEPLAAQFSAQNPAGRPGYTVNVPWRGPDGRYLDPVDGLDAEKLNAEITRMQLDEVLEPAEHLRLAMLYRALGNRYLERARVEAALRRDPNSAPVLIQAAFLRLEDGAIGEGLSLARKALKIAPDDPLGHVVMGAVWLASGNEYEAGREFDQARALEPRLAIDAKVTQGAAAATEGVAVAAPGLQLSVRLAP